MLLEFTDTSYEEKRYICGEGNECLWVRYSCFLPRGLYHTKMVWDPLLL
jgi:hypothetical protein